jgi:hypothetical protein
VYNALSNRTSAKRRKRQRKRQRLRNQQQSILHDGSDSGSNITRAISYAPNNSSTIMASNAISTPFKQRYSQELRSYRVQHSEFITDVNGSVSFAVTPFRINPGESATFPWLTRLALNFEKYRFISLKVSLRTQTRTTPPGAVMLAVDYDPTDSPPSQKSDMLQYQDAVRGAAWDHVSTFATPRQLARELIVSASQSSDTGDQRLEDFGNLFVATQGQTDATVISELWVEYIVELRIPQSGPLCFSQRIVSSLAGAVTSSKSSSGNDLVYDLANVTTSGVIFGKSFRLNRTGNYLILLTAGISGALTGFGDVTINGVGSAADITSNSFGNTLGAVNIINVAITAGAVVLIAFSSPDRTLLTTGLTLYIQEVDPQVF